MLPSGLFAFGYSCGPVCRDTGCGVYVGVVLREGDSERGFGSKSLIFVPYDVLCVYGPEGVVV